MKEEFQNIINCFQDIIISRQNFKQPEYKKIIATFVGIKTNISGVLKLHTYIFLSPFPEKEIYPYLQYYPNIYMKDVCFMVDEDFYLWVYTEMRRLQRMIVMFVEFNTQNFKIMEGNNDLIITLSNKCNEQKEWMQLSFEEWMENNSFNNIFSIIITNPYHYVVPFPVRPIKIKTSPKNDFCNYLIIDKLFE